MFALLAVVHTWPLASDPAHLSRVDNGDYVLNARAISWVAHQLPRQPSHLFDANFFYPERRTLAYSEAMLVQGALAVPLRAAGAGPVMTYNLLFMLGLALTGWAFCGRDSASARQVRPRRTPPLSPAPVSVRSVAGDRLSGRDDGVFGCQTHNSDDYQLVVCIHDHVNPVDSNGAFEVTKRVAWGLRYKGAGLLIKNSGENVIGWKGYNFSASRICYPGGHIWKVIADAGPGGGNGASWQDNGFVDPSTYLLALDPTNSGGCHESRASWKAPRNVKRGGPRNRGRLFFVP